MLFSFQTWKASSQLSCVTDVIFFKYSHVWGNLLHYVFANWILSFISLSFSDLEFYECWVFRLTHLFIWKGNRDRGLHSWLIPIGLQPSGMAHATGRRAEVHLVFDVICRGPSTWAIIGCFPGILRELAWKQTAGTPSCTLPGERRVLVSQGTT